MEFYDRAEHGPLCSYFMHGKCKKGDNCRLFHPPQNMIGTSYVQKEFKRESGQCYCGSYLRTVLNRNPMRRTDEDSPTFYMVCSRTGKSMKKCK
jgi:hypothetical protein